MIGLTNYSPAPITPTPHYFRVWHPHCADSTKTQPLPYPFFVRLGCHGCEFWNSNFPCFKVLLISMTVTQVLDFLGDLHVLEVLNISAWRWGLSASCDNRLRPVQLPRLLRLGLGLKITTFEDCIYFLGHIIPRQGCSLSLDIEVAWFFWWEHNTHEYECLWNWNS
jgi:hypothetical protein